ncbi:magnesium chelatase family protein [Nitratiruptor sp. YY08-14]|nr:MULTISPECIES: ATP-binding protein [unclassified Nitratiruptor]BCD59446.1 magnesium chelatase family protein [Nitratiruptor sp. YY08-10]BCD63370.1 magnesium chelatase family protein [Nitratiruptor sp. YY08-14]
MVKLYLETYRGSSGARPGEVAMAHKGILFFDEFPHFAKSVLEALREPLQDHKVLISRVHSKVEYETTFLFVAAQNPCPCGNLLDSQKECRCTELEIKRYKNRLSEPLLDRIDLYVQMAPMRADDSATYTSQQMHEMVLQAFLMQKRRGQQRLNGKLEEEEIETFCHLDDEAKRVLYQAREKLALSHRSIANIKKVARTIADLDQKESIEKKHILEALSYRRR